MKCKHCGGDIRWTEMMGWVHGRNGEGYRVICNIGVAADVLAEPREEDIEWFTKPFA